MRELEQYSCTNELCEHYGMTHQGNISVRGKYGKDNNRVLLYCRTCGKRFSATQASIRFGLHLPAEKIRKIVLYTSKNKSVRATAHLLEIDKDTVNRVIMKAHEHCTDVLSDLLTSLEMDKTQLKELLAFVKKRNVLTFPKAASTSKDETGS